MKRRKDPDGYIGDEAVNEATEVLMEQLRQKSGTDITLEEIEAQVKEKRRTDPKLRLLPRALGLRLRAVREEREMTREQLSEASNLDVRHIVLMERGTLQNILIGDVLRFCLGLKYSPAQFMEEVQAEAARLAAN
jgi:hypothetical protein